MASNTFRIFGILILALLVYAVINKFTLANQPVVGAAKTFYSALRNQDRSALESVIDGSVVTVTYAGDKVTGMYFKEINVYEGAFSKQPAVTYTYLELLKKDIEPNASSVMTPDKKLATVALTDGGRVYLRQVDGQWKVFYVTTPAPQEEKEEGPMM